VIGGKHSPLPPARYHPSMHWVWRAMIAVIVSCIYAIIPIVPLPPPGVWTSGATASIMPASATIPSWLALHIAPRGQWMEWPSRVVVVGSTSLIAIVVFGGLGQIGRQNEPRGETFCRRCGYILRGISEPRCPECGERI
jgi:hypothetical protein